MISVVVPVYNEENNIETLHQKIKQELDKLKQPYEIIFVDDGSSDTTFEHMKKLSPLKLVRLQKNFGQTSAMDAGFNIAEGNIIITMDGDLQNDPADIQPLINKLNEGYDVVSGWRTKRKDSIGRRLLSWFSNRLTRIISGVALHDHACAIKAYRKDLFKGVHLYGEMHVFLPVYLHGRGAKVAEIPVNHFPRTSGKSKHNLMKAFKNLSDLMTIVFLSRFMDRPLLFFGSYTLLFWGLALVAGGTSTALKVMELRNFGQTPLPILTVLFVIIGFLLFMMGFLAELILRVYFESQNKTPYVVKETKVNS